MSRANDYESIDRDMSCWLLTTTHMGTTFYLSDNESGTATDILANAKRYRYQDQAAAEAKAIEADWGWPWFWEPIMVPEAMARRHTCGPFQSGRCVRCGKVQGIDR